MKIIKFFQVYFLIAISSISTLGQGIDIVWDVTYNDIEGRQELNDFILLNDNRIAMTGFDIVENSRFGLLVFADVKTGKKLKHETYGYPVSNQFNALVSAPDGTIYQVGGIGKGKNTKGWMVRTDAEGELISSERTGEKEENIFKDIKWLYPDNQGLIVGRGDKCSSGNFSVFKVQGNQVVAQENTNIGAFEDVKGIESDLSGGAWIFGNTRKSGGYKKGQIWYVKCDKNLRFKSLNIISDKEWKSVRTSSSGQDGKLLLAGEVFASNSGVKDPWIVEITPLGNEKRSYPIALENNNHVITVLQTPADDIFTVVESEHNRYVTNTYPLRLFWQGLSEVKEYNLPLGGLQFRVKKLLKNPDNTFIIVGTQLSPDDHQPMAMRAVCFKIDDYETEVNRRINEVMASSANVPALQQSQIEFKDENNDGKLSPGEYGFLRFKITNKSADFINNAYIRTRFVESVKGLTTVKNPISTDYLSVDETQYFYLPVYGENYLQTGKSVIKIHIQPENRKLAGLVFEAEIECVSKLKNE